MERVDTDPQHDAGDADAPTVGDAEWQRVRRLAERVAAFEEAVAEMVDPDPDSLARLDRARIKAARAAQRAQLADALAEHLADIRATRRRRTGTS